MLTRILDWSLGHPLLVAAGWALLALGGVLSWLHLPLDAFPDTTPVQVQLYTEAEALGPLEIERQVSRPLEAVLAGIPGAQEVRSLSKAGFSLVTVGFEDDVSATSARQAVAERAQGVALPDGVGRPVLGPQAGGLGEIFHYLVLGEGHSLAELRKVQDWQVRPRLISVPGVAEVNTWGGEERQVEVVVEPANLQRFDLALAELVSALEGNSGTSSGGTLVQGGEATWVRGVGTASRLEEIEEAVVAVRAGVPIRVRDVAKVVDGKRPRQGAVTADGNAEVVLGLAFMRLGDNSREVSSRLGVRLAEIEKSLPAGVRLLPVHDRATLVGRVLATVRDNLLEGALLVVAVLFVFLGSLRAGLLVAAAIPLSMLFAGNLMARFGVAGSLMSLGAIDFGLVVDSSVIQVENVVRRLAGATSGRASKVRDAVIEVRKPTLLGELVIAVVYLPVLTLEGVEGKLFRPMALTVLFALLGSLLLSLTLIPVLIRFGLGPQAASEGRLMEWLKRGYRPLLSFALARPSWVVAATLLVCANAVFLAAHLGSEFVPRLREGTIVINTVRLAGVSLDESVRYGLRLERLLLEKFPDEIDRVWTRTGSAELATDPMGVELSDVYIALTPRKKWRRGSTQEELVKEMAAELEGMPGMRQVFTQPIEMRVNEMGAGARSDLVVKVFGEDLDLLQTKAQEIATVLRALPGAADVIAEQVTGQPVLEVVPDREAAARHAVSAREVLQSVEALRGREVGWLQEGERQVPIVLRLDEKLRRDPDSVGRVLVSSQGGERVPLARVATLRAGELPATLQRDFGQRRVAVQANVRGRDLGGFVAQARRAVEEKVDLPPGTYVRFGGQFEHLASAQRRLAIVVPVTLVLVFLLLLFTYRRVVDAARVFVGVPLAAVGGVFALWARGMPFSISAAVGFVALIGVSVLGDMVLVSAIRQRLRAGRPLRDAVAEAAQTRLRPVLMTALVASLGFVPMALNTGIGAEVQRPLATVLIGGVLSSTALTLLVLPVLYVLVAPRGASSQGSVLS